MFSIQLTILTLSFYIVLSYESYFDFDSPSSGIPTNLFWGKVNGTSFLTVSRNQKSLVYCTGSWAIAATTVLSDRFKVLRNASWPDYNISPQIALSCISSVPGCFEEGDPALVYDYILQNGIPDETCAVYQGRDFSNGAPCWYWARCVTSCSPNGDCDLPFRYYLYNITGYTVVAGQNQMINALQTGPIVCRLNSTEEFIAYNSSDILVPEDLPSNGTVYVSIVGYGVDSDGINYWIGRNSWGTAWGDFGFFNLIRGINALGIEEYCVYPTPNLTLTAVTANSLGEEEKTFINGFEIPKNEPRSFRFNRDGSLAAVPSVWDWRNINGKNYLSWVRNQNLPRADNYDWAFASASSITDRFNIMYFNGTLPQFTLSVQDLLQQSGYQQKYLYKTLQAGVSDDTCLQYTSYNPGTFQCIDCAPPTPTQWESWACFDVHPPIKFKISSYKHLAGATKMMQEIYTNGPITCAIYASNGFANYAGGIYNENAKITTNLQYVSVVGWGVDPTTKTQYWIGRNSFGTFWGEYGFFKMQMYRDNLGIENDCVAAVPAFK